MEGVTELIKKMEKFVFNLHSKKDWATTLKSNKKIGRKLLMAIKDHSRPDNNNA